MQAVATEKAPSPSVVIPHYVAGALGFFLSAIFFLLFHDRLAGSYQQAELFALAHLVVLGFMNLIIFGALYQLVPVILETSLYSERLAKVNFWLFLMGLSGLIGGFMLKEFRLMVPFFAVETWVALILFVYNIARSFRGAVRLTASGRFILLAIFWLMMTASAGLVLAFNLRDGFLGGMMPEVLKLHFHWGVVGWFLQLVMGVSATLLPMFLVSHPSSDGALKQAFYWLNGGLILATINWLSNSSGYLSRLTWLFIGIAILLDIKYLYGAFRQKVKKLDPGMLISVLAFLLLGLPFLTAGFLLFFDASPRFYVFYGVSVLMAFFVPLILGQTYKTLPFIVWLSKYQKHIGKRKTPMPAELYSMPLARIHLAGYIVALIFLLVGIGLRQKAILLVAGILLTLTALLYLRNVLKIVFHRTDTGVETHPKTNDLMQALRQVIDPELNINIVDLGLIYEVNIDEQNKRVEIKMTLSTPNCPVGDTIVMNVIQTVQSAMPAGYDADVHLVFDPPWSPEKISEAGKKALARQSAK